MDRDVPRKRALKNYRRRLAMVTWLVASRRFDLRRRNAALGSGYSPHWAVRYWPIWAEARMRPIRCAAAIVGALALAGCAVAPPTGPDVMVLPGQDKSFEAFQADDAACRQYASAQIGYASPAEAATESGVGSTALGTVLGAAAGSALGAAPGKPPPGGATRRGGGVVSRGGAGTRAAPG